MGWPRPQGRGDRPTSWWGVTTVPTFEGSLPPGVLASRCAVAPGTGPRRPGGGRRAGAPTWQRVGRGRNADKRLRAWPLPGVPHRPREHSVGTQGTLTARGIRSRGPARLDPGQVRLWARGPAGCRSTASGQQPVSFPTPVRPWGTSWRVACSHVSHPCSPPSLGLPGLSAKPGSPDGFIHRVRCSWTSCRPARWLPQLFSSGRGSRWAGEGRQAGGAPGQPGNTVPDPVWGRGRVSPREPAGLFAGNGGTALSVPLSALSRHRVRPGRSSPSSRRKKAPWCAGRSPRASVMLSP